MSVFDWVSHPKLRLTQLMEKMVSSLSYGARKNADRGFSGRILSDRGNYQLGEARLRLAPVPAGRSPSFSHRDRLMHEGKILQ